MVLALAANNETGKETRIGYFTAAPPPLCWRPVPFRVLKFHSVPADAALKSCRARVGVVRKEESSEMADSNPSNIFVVMGASVRACKQS